MGADKKETPPRRQPAPTRPLLAPAERSAARARPLGGGGLEGAGKGRAKHRRDARRGRAPPAPDLAALDWAKFTHFRARNSAGDLERLHRACSSAGTRRQGQSGNLFEAAKPDKTGLWPIHWAAINDRSDMIEYMLRQGAAPDKRCQNRLLANGTPLHLAAMNGALEAAGALLLQADGGARGNRQDSPEGPEEAMRDEKRKEREGLARAGGQDERQLVGARSGRLLALRDADGQTALMRAAVHRSKRMDTIRDLLRKNFWSLSGRPAEMALYLICNGAEWREREPVNGMNLMHLAVVNGHDDIVSLLLVLDKQLLEVPAITGEPPERKVQPEPASEASETGSSPSEPRRRLQEEPLISGRERAHEMLANGLRPLQLAILYGHVAIISRLWHARQRERAGPHEMDAGQGHAEAPTEGPKRRQAPLELQRQALDERSLSGKQLKTLLLRASWSNRNELAKLLKAMLLKGLLMVDLALLVLLWAPQYGARDGPLGVFLVSCGLSLALALRVALRNPGYLRRNSLQYLELMGGLTRGRKQPHETPGRPEATALIRLDSTSPISSPDSREGARAQANVAPANSAPPAAGTGTGTATGSGTATAQEPAERLGPPGGSLGQRADWPLAGFGLEDTVRLLCHKCQCVRRPRSRHCDHCNHCVQDFDHHCIYLGCCIGRQNRLDFLACLLALTITGLYGALLAARQPEREWALWEALGLLWVLKYALAGLLLAFQNMRRACLGVSLYEEIRSRRIRRLFGRPGTPAHISRSHGAFSTLKGSYWRYDPDRFLTGDLGAGELAQNLREFANHVSLDEYLLGLVCADTPLGRAIVSGDSRVAAM